MIYVVDLDGTLCETRDGDYEQAVPRPDRIAALNARYREGHIVKIDTARGSQTGIDWRELTVKQLAEWGILYHQLRCGVKWFGDIYIDDRAVPAHEFFR